MATILYNIRAFKDLIFFHFYFIEQFTQAWLRFIDRIFDFLSVFKHCFLFFRRGLCRSLIFTSWVRFISRVNFLISLFIFRFGTFLIILNLNGIFQIQSREFRFLNYFLAFNLFVWFLFTILARNLILIHRIFVEFFYRFFFFILRAVFLNIFCFK